MEQQKILEAVASLVPAKSRADFLKLFCVPEKELKAFLSDFEQCGKEWGYQPANPLALKLICALCDSLGIPTKLLGLEYLKEAKERSEKGEAVVMIGNHLSYGDVNYLQTRLVNEGLKDFPFLVMAGPKVYQDPFRKVAAMTFETLKIAQPPSRSTGQAVLPARELAEVARVVQAHVELYMAKARILYFFPEGSRSRSGAMDRFIPASARYLEKARPWIISVGFDGTQDLLGVDKNEVTGQDISISAGPLLSYDKLMQGFESNSAREVRKKIMNRLGFTVAANLPKERQGIYALSGALEDKDLEAARDWYLTVFCNQIK